MYPPGWKIDTLLPEMSTEWELVMKTRYTISNGKIVLNLELAEEGGYVVTSPLDA